MSTIILNNEYNITFTNEGTIGYIDIGNYSPSLIFFNSDMSNFANSCGSLNCNMQNINLRNDYITNMYSAFKFCYNLTGSPICYPNVTNMCLAYLLCNNITGTAACGDNVINMSAAYCSCSNLTGSPVCGEDVVDFSVTYRSCTNLTGNPVCGNNVTDMRYAYDGCLKLTGSPVCGEKVTDMRGTYDRCYNLSGTAVCGNNVTDLSYTYENCNNLTGSPVCGYNVTNMYAAYLNCTNLTGSAACGPNVTNMYKAYYYCNKLNEANIGMNVINASYAYYNCYNLLYMDGFVDSATNMSYTYYNCRNINGLMFWSYNNTSNNSYNLVNCCNLFYNHNSSYRLRIVCAPNSAPYNRLYQCASNASDSIFGTTITWTNSNIGFYNSTYNMYVQDNVYVPVTYNLTNVTGSASNPTEVSVNGDAATITVTADSEYNLPDTITVTGVYDYTWNKDTGIIRIWGDSAYDSISVEVVGEASGYTITYNLTNCTGSASNPTKLEGTSGISAYFYTNTGYRIDSVSVTGDNTWGWNVQTGELAFMPPYSSNAVVTIVATEYTELCFTAKTAGSTVELCAVGSPSIANTAYSRDRITWTTFTPSTTAGTNTITLTNAGDKVYFRNDITGDFSNSAYPHFEMSGSIYASGNINSMYTSTGFNSLTTLSYAYCFAALFMNCTSLITPPSLPATTLSLGCYSTMFALCTNLTTVPSLPAKLLVNNCYSTMFYNCTALWVNDSYGSACSHQWYIPAKGVLTNETLSLGYMFLNCRGTRTYDYLPGVQYKRYTYYTQNEPVQ